MTEKQSSSSVPSVSFFMFSNDKKNTQDQQLPLMDDGNDSIPFAQIIPPPQLTFVDHQRINNSSYKHFTPRITEVFDDTTEDDEEDTTVIGNGNGNENRNNKSNKQQPRVQKQDQQQQQQQAETMNSTTKKTTHLLSSTAMRPSDQRSDVQHNASAMRPIDKKSDVQHNASAMRPSDQRSDVQTRAASPSLLEISNDVPVVPVFLSKTMTDDMNAAGRSSPTHHLHHMEADHLDLTHGAGAEVTSRERIKSPVAFLQTMIQTTTTTTTTAAATNPDSTNTTETLPIIQEEELVPVSYSTIVTRDEFFRSFLRKSSPTPIDATTNITNTTTSYLDTLLPTDPDKQRLKDALVFSISQSTTVDPVFFWTNVWTWMIEMFLCSEWHKWWLTTCYPSEKKYPIGEHHPYVQTLKTFANTTLYKRLLVRENFIRWQIPFEATPDDPPATLLLDELESYVRKCLELLHVHGKQKSVDWTFAHWLSILHVEPSEALLNMHCEYFVHETTSTRGMCPNGSFFDAKPEHQRTILTQFVKTDPERRDLFYYASQQHNRSIVFYLLSNDVRPLGQLGIFQKQVQMYERLVRQTPLFQWYSYFCMLQDRLNERSSPPGPDMLGGDSELDMEDIQYMILQGQRTDALGVVTRMLANVDRMPPDEFVPFDYAQELRNFVYDAENIAVVANPEQRRFLQEKSFRHFTTVVNYMRTYLECLDQEREHQDIENDIRQLEIDGFHDSPSSFSSSSYSSSSQSSFTSGGDDGTSNHAATSSSSKQQPAPPPPPPTLVMNQQQRRVLPSPQPRSQQTKEK
jgi:hypothetical protein